MAEAILDVVNENDEIIGSAPRSQIHKEGLLHREIHVWFITPDAKVIMQRRSATKDTYPNLLDVAAGGHVELGASYADTALAEVQEETGLQLGADDLHLLAKKRSCAFDDVTGMTNNVFRHIYAYLFRGQINEMTIEASDAVGFEECTLASMFDPTEDMRENLVPGLIDPKNHDILHALQKLVR